MNFSSDFSANKDRLLKILKNKNKILNFTHIDMDGIGANIVLSKLFSNVVRIDVNYHDIDERIRNFDFSEFQFVIFTDICPVNSLEYLSQFDNVIILDHHQTAAPFCNPEKNVFVYEGLSGTKLTHEFLKSMFGNLSQLSEIDELVDIINDYDMWIRKNPKSTYFNWLFNKYKADEFKTRFISGNTKLLKDEKDFILSQHDTINRMFDALEINEFETVNGAMFLFDDYVNDLGQMVMDKYKYDFIIMINKSNLSASVRSVGECDVATMLSSLGIGGGHKNAAGFRNVSSDILMYNMKNIEQYVYRFYKFVRK